MEQLDYSLGASRLDTDNARPNNQYQFDQRASRTSAGRRTRPYASGSLITYSLADTGNPNTIFDPKPLDNFLTERWLIGPHIDCNQSNGGTTTSSSATTTSAN